MYVDWENHPYKGGWLEIGPLRREGMNQNTPNPGLTLRWQHPSSSTHWMEWRSCPECQTSTTVVLYTRSGWREGTEMGEVIPCRGIMLNHRGKYRIKALGGTGESDRLQMQTRWNWRDHAGFAPFHFPHNLNSPLLSVAPNGILI